MATRTGLIFIVFWVFWLPREIPGLELPGSARPESPTQVEFSWSVAAIRQADQGEELISIGASTSLRQGDLLKIRLEPKTDCFIYLLHISTDQRLQLLFPRDLGVSRADQAGREFLIPEGDEWFSIEDPPGSEKLYLLASKDRLVSLEKLLREDTDKETIREQILREVGRIRLRASGFEAAAERPASIAGRLRGQGGQLRGLQAMQFLRNQIVSVSTPEVYAQTITITH